MLLTLTKRIDGVLVPATEQDAEYISKIKDGITAEVKQFRNVRFHKKLFALLNYAFDNWEPEQKEYKGEVIQKNFERFRADIIILAGFYTSTVNIKGEVRLMPKSISFAKMKEEEFNKLYQSVLTVIIEKILTNYRKEDVERVMNNLIGFS